MEKLTKLFVCPHRIVLSKICLGPFAVDQNGSEVLHIAVEKVTKLIFANNIIWYYGEGI